MSLHLSFLSGCAGQSQRLSIPVIGILSLHQRRLNTPRIVPDDFQFPLLGFCLCITLNWWHFPYPQSYFQFPLLGFCLCIRVSSAQIRDGNGILSIPVIGILSLHPMRKHSRAHSAPWLSIPVIGILSLHLQLRSEFPWPSRVTFNSRYWDFVSASWFTKPIPVDCTKSFNSRYWDFVSAS